MLGHARITVLGTVGKDAELKLISNDTKVAKFSIAINKKFTTKSGEAKETTTWFNVECWNKLAEIASNYVKKGRVVYVEGDPVIETYTSKDNQEKMGFKIVCGVLQLLPDGKQHGNSSENAAATATANAKEYVATGKQQPEVVTASNTSFVAQDEDLPF